MDAYFAALHELWHRGEPPSRDEERALMARFGNGDRLTPSSSDGPRSVVAVLLVVAVASRR
jgi:hypothetical protein